MSGTYSFSTMSRSGNSRVAFIPSSRRPGFFGIAVFSRTGVDSAVIGAKSTVRGSRPRPGGPARLPGGRPGAGSPGGSVVVRAAEEVAAAADELALALVHRCSAVGAGQDHGRRIRVDLVVQNAQHRSERRPRRTGSGAGVVVHGSASPGHGVMLGVAQGIIERPGSSLRLE